MQDGVYIVNSTPKSNENLPHYTTFPFNDLENKNDMHPLLGNCFTNLTNVTIDTNAVAAVNSCMDDTKLCCYAGVNSQVSLLHGQQHVAAEHVRIPPYAWDLKAVKSMEPPCGTST